MKVVSLLPLYLTVRGNTFLNKRNASFDKCPALVVENGSVKCEKNTCELSTCKKGHHRVKSNSRSKKLKCQVDKTTNTFSWSNENMWSCSACKDMEPLKKNKDFNTKCRYKTVAGFKLKVCSFTCSNGSFIYPVAKREMSLTCKCMSNDSECHWRRGHHAYDMGDEYDLSKWKCQAPVIKLPTGLKCKSQQRSASSNASSWIDGRDRIVGGEEATPHSWPWIVRLEFNNEASCAGTIVDDKTIVTAAHCCDEAKSVKIIAGDHHYSTYDKGETEFTSRKIIMHPAYDYYTLESDICMVKLESGDSFENTENAEAACLPEKQQVLKPGTRCWTAGWGSLTYGGDYPEALQEVDLELFSDQYCQESKLGNEYFAESMMCAGSPHGGKDACQGDSGGPLICAVDGEPVLIGVTSWGQKCAKKNSPGVWAKVSWNKHWNFIASHMNSQ